MSRLHWKQSGEEQIEASRWGPRLGRALLKVIAPVGGLAALVWFLIRVIPKPSRAMYPCQRVAFPLASGFVIWLTGALGSVAAFRKAQKNLVRARYLVAGLCVAASISFLWLAMSATNPENAAAAIRAAQPANSPIGTAKGVYPGRVVWIHDANSTDWAGPMTGEHWYSDACADKKVIAEMLSKALRGLTGTTTDEAAWDALFRDYNQRAGRGDVGYTAGEKIAIKVNHTLCFNSSPLTMEKPDDAWHQDPPFDDCPDNSPQLTMALLQQLTDVAGVEPNKISIGDPGRIMPNFWYYRIEPNCPGVVYLTRDGAPSVLNGRVIETWSDVEFHFSDPLPSRTNNVVEIDHVPTHIAEADYFINFAVLKDHASAGITVCGKNLYGSLIRNPDAWDMPVKDDWYDMHLTLAWAVPVMGQYRPMVDLLGHPELGGKTILCLVDGLFAGRNWDGVPYRWNMAPFNGDWPSSIFVSQDPVAMDSVCFDFLITEWPYYNDPDPKKTNGAKIEGSDDYLHEAALVPNPPSGTNYDPNEDGGLTESLGVHEHWNNSTDKQYTRNLDPNNGTGIELVREGPMMGDFDGNAFVNFDDYAMLLEALGTFAGQAGWDPNLDISMPSDLVIDEADVEVFCDYWLNGIMPPLPPKAARNPNPSHGATGVAIDANLSWTAGAGAESHDVYFGTTTTPVFIGNQTATTYDPGLLQEATTYFWRIDEKNANGTTTGAVWSFLAGPPDTTPPLEPNDLTATGGYRHVSLDWTDNNEPDLSHYRVKRSSSAGGPYDVIAWNVAVSEYTDSELSAGMTYYYVVSAVDSSNNESSDCNEVSATPTAGITFDAASSGGSTAFTSSLSWQHTVGAGDNRLLVVGTEAECADGNEPYLPIQSLTFNGVQLVKAGSEIIDTGYALMSELWYLPEANLPAAGTYTIEAAFSGEVRACTGGAISVFGAAQEGPEDVNTSIATEVPISCSVESSAGAWVFDAVGCGNDAGTFTPQIAGMVERYEVVAGPGDPVYGCVGAGSTSEATLAGNVTAQWDCSAVSRMSQVVASFPVAP